MDNVDRKIPNGRYYQQFTSYNHLYYAHMFKGYVSVYNGAVHPTKEGMTFRLTETFDLHHMRLDITHAFDTGELIPRMKIGNRNNYIELKVVDEYTEELILDYRNWYTNSSGDFIQGKGITLNQAEWVNLSEALPDWMTLFEKYAGDEIALLFPTPATITPLMSIATKITKESKKVKRVKK